VRWSAGLGFRGYGLVGVFGGFRVYFFGFLGFGGACLSAIGVIEMGSLGLFLGLFGGFGGVFGGFGGLFVYFLCVLGMCFVRVCVFLSYSFFRSVFLFRCSLNTCTSLGFLGGLVRLRRFWGPKSRAKEHDTNRNLTRYRVGGCVA